MEMDDVFDIFRKWGARATLTCGRVQTWRVTGAQGSLMRAYRRGGGGAILLVVFVLVPAGDCEDMNDLESSKAWRLRSCLALLCPMHFGVFCVSLLYTCVVSSSLTIKNLAHLFMGIPVRRFVCPSVANPQK